MINFDDFNNDFSEKMCPRCKMSLSSVIDSDVVGCAYCYDAFKDEIRNILLQKQGNFNHVGKISSKHFSKIKIKEQVEKLENEKEQAIKDENFILAEALKNQIDKLKGEL